jgi:dTDP-4-dehydrorhamnose reductase
MTRILVTGSAGMLGHDVVSLLREHGEDVTALTRDELDIRDEARVRSAMGDLKPDVVVNCAAWTAVDDAERHEDEALALNGHAVAVLAAACRDSGAKLVHPSTDYVFPGDATSPYAEDAATGPRSAYGRTKLAGERAVREMLPESGYVVRTAWLYGAHGKNFVYTMMRLARAGKSPSVVDDQHGQPTWTADVARQIHALIATGAPPGVYHATSSGQTTWCGFAREIFEKLSTERSRALSAPTGIAAPFPREITVTPITTAEYPLPAPRPAYSVLGHSAWEPAGIQPIGDWRDALHRAFPELLAASPGGTTAQTPPCEKRV